MKIELFSTLSLFEFFSSHINFITVTVVWRVYLTQHITNV